MRIVELTQAEPYAAGNLRTGNYDEKVMGTGIEDSPDNFRLSYATATEDSMTNRHRHNFEQIRYSITGDFRYGNGKDEVIPPGWVAYFPESIHYGPQVRKEGALTLYFQFGPASGAGYMSLRQRRQGYKDLIEKGKFENGAYTYFDADGRRHNRDAFEAVWEQALGRKLEYAPPRYASVVLMNPAAYAWVEDPNNPGVAHKWLGSFTERGTRVGFVRLAAGASLTIDPQDATHVLFLVSGSVTADGQSRPLHTAFTLPPMSEAATVAADTASELYYIELPSLAVAAGQARSEPARRVG